MVINKNKDFYLIKIKSNRKDSFCRFVANKKEVRISQKNYNVEDEFFNEFLFI